MKIRAVENNLYSAGTLKLAGIIEPGTVVGIVELFNYDPINQRAAVGIVVDTAYRRQGYGKALIDGVVNFCRENLSIHQLYCDIIDSNNVSQHLFENCGFVKCGHFPEWILSDETYHDSIRMSILLH